MTFSEQTFQNLLAHKFAFIIGFRELKNDESHRVTDLRSYGVTHGIVPNVRSEAHENPTKIGNIQIFVSMPTLALILVSQ